MSMAQAVMAGAGQGIMVQGDSGQLLQQQLLMAQRCRKKHLYEKEKPSNIRFRRICFKLSVSRPGIAPGMMLGQGMQLGGMPGIPGMQV